MIDQEGLAIYHQRRTERLQAKLEDAASKAESIKLSDDNGDPLPEMTQRLWKPLVVKTFELIQKHLTEASVGTTFAWLADTPLPPGYRRCNGQLLSAEEFWEYAGLPNTVGTTIGTGAYAKVPDLPGMIIKVTCADEPVPEAGGLKFDQDKPPLDLLPMEALLQVADVLKDGAKKYGRNNWQKGMRWTRLLGGALRHLFAWGKGEDTDPETGRSHLAHAACCVLFLMSYQTYQKGDDDRDQMRV